jgi:hypothetical protein
MIKAEVEQFRKAEHESIMPLRLTLFIIEIKSEWVYKLLNMRNSPTDLIRLMWQARNQMHEFYRSYPKIGYQASENWYEFLPSVKEVINKSWWKKRAEDTLKKYEQAFNNLKHVTDEDILNFMTRNLVPTEKVVANLTLRVDQMHNSIVFPQPASHSIKNHLFDRDQNQVTLINGKKKGFRATYLMYMPIHEITKGEMSDKDLVKLFSLDLPDYEKPADEAANYVITKLLKPLSNCQKELLNIKSMKRTLAAIEGAEGDEIPDAELRALGLTTESTERKGIITELRANYKTLREKLEKEISNRYKGTICLSHDISFCCVG